MSSQLSLPPTKIHWTKQISGNPKRHISALQGLKSQVCQGEPSLQNVLHLAMQTLRWFTAFVLSISFLKKKKKNLPWFANEVIVVLQAHADTREQRSVDSIWKPHNVWPRRHWRNHSSKPVRFYFGLQNCREKSGKMQQNESSTEISFVTFCRNWRITTFAVQSLDFLRRFVFAKGFAVKRKVMSRTP